MFEKKYDICVFGGLALDQTYYQHEDGSYSETPDALYNGGKAGNQAVAASRAGAKVVLISKLGKNDIGEKMINNLKFNGVDTVGVELVENLENDYSDIYINILDKDNEIIRHGNCIDSFDTEMIERNKDLILNSTIVVCQLKCPIEVTKKLLDFCYEHNKKVIMTPCRPNKLIGQLELLDKITYITCNKSECETIFGTNDIEKCIKQYPNKLIVTLGSEGLVYYNGERIVRMPSLNVNVLDTTGAGDTLNGNLAYLLSQGMDLRHALRRSMYASTMKIQVKSAQAGMPYKEELDEYISNYRNRDFKYKKELDSAMNIIKNAYFRIRSNKDLYIRVKEDNTLVTNIDVETEKYIIDSIKKEFKEDNFLSEESNPKGVLLDRTWVIDPIDGTSQFINNSSDWGIQLAFYDNKETQFSIIYLPKKDEMYYACLGKGAYLNNNKIMKEDNIKPLKQCLIEFSGSIEKELDSKIVVFKKLHENNERKVADFRYINSSCLAFTNLAKGVTSGLILSTKKYWDIMPGILICKEAGINMYNMDFENRLTLLTGNEEIKNVVLSSPDIELETEKSMAKIRK